MIRQTTRAVPTRQPDASFNLYATEEAVLEKSDAMLRQLTEVADGVQGLADSYRRSYREQRQLVRMSDRMQFDLHKANQRLADQARELQDLNEKLSSEIERRVGLEAELRRLAETDSLTGTLSRRRFIELGEAEWQRQAQTGSRACLLLLDLDRFKAINDVHGHAAGDKTLATFGALCRSAMRPLDLIGRLGGEEFAMILPDTSEEDGFAIADRLRIEVATSVVPAVGGPLALSVSIGVAHGMPGEALEDAMSRADKALYEAKHAGRNRVRAFSADASTREGAR